MRTKLVALMGLPSRRGRLSLESPLGGGSRILTRHAHAAEISEAKVQIGLWLGPLLPARVSAFGISGCVAAKLS